MTLAEAYFHFLKRKPGRDGYSRGRIAPIRLECGRFDLWAVAAAAYCSCAGLLENVDGKTAKPAEMNALLRCARITIGSGINDAEQFVTKMLEVLRDVKATTRAAYATARASSANLDAESDGEEM